MQKTIGIVITIFLAVFTFSKTVMAQPLGEHLSYNVYYKWGIIKINGGSLTLTTSPDTVDGTALIRVDGVGKSAAKWSWLFELEDHYTSWYYPKTFLPVKSIKNTNEGGYFIHNLYKFNYKDSLIYIRTEQSRKPLSYDTLRMKGTIFDAQAATYHLRFLDFDNYHPNDTLTFSIIMDGVVHEQDIVYLGHDTITDRQKNSYATFCFTAVVDDSKLFSSSDAIKVWISDDERRIPLLIQADITVGYIEVLYNNDSVNNN